MTTYTYNTENYTGNTETVRIFANTFHSSLGKGTWKETTEGVVSVKLEGYSEAIKAYLIGNEWTAMDYDISREDSNPVIAALKVMHNTY